MWLVCAAAIVGRIRRATEDNYNAEITICYHSPANRPLRRCPARQLLCRQQVHRNVHAHLLNVTTWGSRWWRKASWDVVGGGAISTV